MVNILTVEVFCKGLSQLSFIHEVPAHRHDEVSSVTILLNRLHQLGVVFHPAWLNVLAGWLTGETHQRVEVVNTLEIQRQLIRI